MKNESFNKVFIGSGLMAEIFLHALIHQKGESPNDFYILGKHSERCLQLMKKYKIRASTNFNAFVSKAKVVVLAVDRTDIGDIPDLVKDIIDKVPSDALINSVTPYLRIEQIEKFFPNHPVMRLGVGFSAISGNNCGTYVCGSVTPADTAPVAKFLIECFGELIEVKSEDEFETIYNVMFAQSTAAYVTLKNMIEASQKFGLPPKIARKLAINSMKGAAKTFEEKYNDDLLRRFFEYKDVIQMGLELSHELGSLETSGQTLDVKPEKLKDYVEKLRAEEDKENYEFYYKYW